MGCRYCMLACPFQVPVYEWSKALPKVRKCDMCSARLASGKPTACSEACPTGATMTGDREALVEEASDGWRRIPSSTTDASTGLPRSAARRSSCSPPCLSSSSDFRAGLPQEPLPVLTGRVLAFVPDVVGVGGVLLGGIYWITHRREEVAAAEGPSRRPEGEAP